ncbi:hypothetical protein F5887DRAFT_983382 [Amanita rubescens]|nr:hypothetical protein F5887DRAFT_983382 [Amanita rubescens]
MRLNMFWCLWTSLGLESWEPSADMGFRNNVGYSLNVTVCRLTGRRWTITTDDYWNVSNNYRVRRRLEIDNR